MIPRFELSTRQTPKSANAPEPDPSDSSDGSEASTTKTPGPGHSQSGWQTDPVISFGHSQTARMVGARQLLRYTFSGEAVESLANCVPVLVLGIANRGRGQPQEMSAPQAGSREMRGRNYSRRSHQSGQG
jgi:hypothetical protein